MLEEYEEKFKAKSTKKFQPISSITNEYWVRQLKLLNTNLAKQKRIS